MRIYVILMTATALSACGGGGPQTAGGSAVTGGAVTGPNGATHSFVTPTVTKTYSAQGTGQYFQYDYNENYQFDRELAIDSNGAQLFDGDGQPLYRTIESSRRLTGISQRPQFYSANASTVRDPGVTVTYDPKNAQYTIVVAQGEVKANINFQDPLHRTDFSGLRTPQEGVPNLEIPNQTDFRLRGVQYLEAGTGTVEGSVYDRTTFFYELPGTTTKYVTYAGYVRNHTEKPVETSLNANNLVENRVMKRLTRLERGAFVFGEKTLNGNVPTTGSATYTGNMIASVINNPSFDTELIPATYFQWMSGTGTVGVNFGSGLVTTSVSGTLGPALNDTDMSPWSAPLASAANPNNISNPTPFMPAGSTFQASGSGQIDLVKTGGFSGTFDTATFTGGGNTQSLQIAGSTFDGAFYGPNAEETGTSFRIVGGIPDQRVDVIGAFTGIKGQ